MIAILARITGISPLLVEGIIIAALLGGFGVGAWKIYDAGYAAAGSKCEAEALQSKLDAMQKDRDNARAAAADASLKLAALEAQSKIEEERTAAYVEDLKNHPAPGCALTCDDLRGMRIASSACPALPRAAASLRRSLFPGRGAAPGAR